MSLVRKSGFVALGIICSAVLVTACFPPQTVRPFAWICLIPFLVSVHGTRFIVGFLSGLAVFGLSLGGQSVFGSVGDAAWLVAGYGLMGFVAGVVGGVLADSKKPTWLLCLFLGAFAVVMEGLSGLKLPVHLALTQHASWMAMRLASVGGIWLVSFLLWLANVMGARAIAARTKTAVWVIPVVAAFGLVSMISVPSYGTGKFTVAAIQTENQDIESLAKLSQSAARQGATLVVWPENSSVDIVKKGNTTPLKNLSASGGMPAFVTTFEDTNQPLPHNTAALYWMGNESKFYYKRKPFGGESFVHAAGDHVQVADWAVPIGLNICFDSCYPQIIRDSVLNGAEAIALPTADPDDHAIRELHAAYTAFRAAELGVPVIRAELRGDSTVYGSHGEVVASLGDHEGILVSKLTDPVPTVYRTLGDWVLYLCWAGIVLGAANAARVRFNQSRKHAQSRTLNPEP